MNQVLTVFNEREENHFIRICVYNTVLKMLKKIAIELSKTSNNEESYIRHKFNEREENHFIRIRVYNIVLKM